MTDIEKMIGKTPVSIDVEGEDEIKFTFDDGTFVRFYHEQDCCETVWVEDISGNFADLIGNPILVASERTEYGDDDDYGTYTYTFYCFRGIGGSVDVRWNGESNGYYSESVHMTWG